jgi:phosphopantetheine adenylyltransferase
VSVAQDVSSKLTDDSRSTMELLVVFVSPDTNNRANQVNQVSEENSEPGIHCMHYVDAINV